MTNCPSCQHPLRQLATASDFDKVCRTTACAMAGHRVDSHGRVEAYRLYRPNAATTDWRSAEQRRLVMAHG